MKPRIISLITAIILISLIFASCGSESSVVLRFAVSNRAITFDPQIAESGTAKIIVRNTFEGLMRPDQNGEMKPAAAENYTVSADGLTYTFNIRKGVKWYITDNAREQLESKLPENFAPEVTADDFVFALQRAVDPATGAADSTILSSVLNAEEIINGEKQSEELGVTALDTYTLEIRLKAADDNFLSVLAEPITMPCNRTFFDACGGRYGLLIAYNMSNGPFYLSYFDESTYRLRKCSGYTGVNTAKADTLWFYVNTDEASIIKKLDNEDYNGAFLSQASIDGMSLGKTDNVITVNDTNRVFFINTANENLSNKNLRLAFLYGTDISYICDTAGMTKVNSVVPECVGKTEVQNDFYNTDNVQTVLDTALEELKSEDVTVTVLVDTSNGETLKKQLQQWQKIFGIKLNIKLEQVEKSELLSRVKSGDYEIAFYPLQTDYNDGRTVFDDILSITGLQNDTLNGVISQFKQASDEEKPELIKQADEILINEVAAIPVWSEASNFVCMNSLDGVYVGAGKDRIYFENAYTEE